MNVLFTGNLPVVSDAFFAAVSEEYRCVVFYEKEKLNFHEKNVLTYFREEDEGELANVFNAFGFETVVYFSYTIDGNKEPFGELEHLENVLYQCRKKCAKRLVYITCNNLPLAEREQVEETGYLILKEACEYLCRHAAAKHGIKIEIVKVPYLYRKDAGEDSFSFLRDAVHKGKVHFPGRADFTTDFLCDSDLGELVGRMLDEPCPEDFIIMHLDGGNRITFGELAEELQKYLPELTVTFGSDCDCVPRCRKGKKPRTEYGWYPKERLSGVIDTVLRGDSLKKKRNPSYLRRKRKGEFKEKLRVVLELIITFVIAEAINLFVSGNVMINFIDFRLIYVVIMGTLNGLNAGIAAAVLSCIGYYVQSASTTPWQILFYNVQNWLPFACYALLGAVSGYTRDKHDDEVLYAKEEYGILEDKYVFLSGLYLEVLAGKEEFNHQIIGYRESYGKMYSIIKKLDSTLPEQVFYEAVSVLEDMLENRYVAIYSIDTRSDFARLNVCSKDCSHRVGKSMKLTDYPVILEALRANEMFENRQALPDYPAYAAPIFREHQLVGMILLMKAGTHQMNMEFSNKFRIVTNLIRDSLIRAMDYYDNSNAILDGTRILETESFEEILEVKRQMRQKQYLEYSLLKVKRNGMTLRELGDKIVTVVRNNDVLGKAPGGDLYLLLSQTGIEDLKVVEERLQKKDIDYEVVTEE